MDRIFTEPNKILICYRRTDIRFAKQLVFQLKQRFGIDCFLDEHCHKEGYPWRPYWREQLRALVDPVHAPGLGPTVIVIATQAAAEIKQPEDIVVEEIREALTPEAPVAELPVVILRFGSEGWPILEARLTKKVSEVGHPTGADPADLIRRLHQPPSLPADWIRADLGEAEWLTIARHVVTNVRAYFLNILSREREKTKAWCASVLQRPLAGSVHDFSAIQPSRMGLHEAIQALATAGGAGDAIAVVSPGGLGKTTQVARSLLTAMDSTHGSTFFPVILSTEDLSRLDEALRERLGVTWASKESPVSLSDEGLYWFRDKLCFLTDSLERADEVGKVAARLERLRGPAKLLVTSRPEAWATARTVLAVGDDQTHRLEKIGEKHVETTLGLFGNKIPSRPYLRNPVFLDIAISLSRDAAAPIDSGLESETELLDRFKRLSLETPTNQVRTESDHLRKRLRASLSSLARHQLRLGRFNVPLKLLHDEELAEAIAHLEENGRLLLMEGLAPERTVRLRHDFVDAHNIADLLDEQPDLLPEALATLRLGFGEVAFEGIVQAAYDRKAENPASEHLLDAFFDEFLRLVDHKNRADLNAGAWNSGYVIIAKFPAFVDRIRKSLCGRYLGPVPKGAAAARHSGTGADGVHGLTQQAMSSVASMLMSAAPLSVPDPERELIGALERHVQCTPYRGRLLEGLAKIQRGDEVLAALEHYVRDEAFIVRDPGVVKYLAAALADVARGDATKYSRRVEDSLTLLASYFEKDGRLSSPVILRSIYDAQDEAKRMRGEKSRTARPIDPAEILEGLRNNEDGDRAGFSDWTTVERYLNEVRDNRGIIQGAPRADVVLAVGRAMWHHHLRCRERAVITLGAIDHPLARGLLLHAFTFEDEDGPMTQIVAALRRQFERLRAAPPERGDRFRLALARSAASRARNRKRPRSEEISDMLLGSGGVGGGLATEGFIELRRFAERLPELVALDAASPAEAPSWLTHDERNAYVGEEKEAKVALRRTTPGPRNAIDWVESSWRTPRRLHKALQDRGRFFRDVIGNDPTMDASAPPGWDIWKDRDSGPFAAHVEAIAQLHAAFEDAIDWPSIATVHAIVITSDGDYIEAKRASDSDYSPDAWSVSFEEQLNREDIDGGAGFSTCVLRGLEEEFGVRVKPNELKVGASSFGVEWAIGNAVLLVLAELEFTSADFVARAELGSPDGEIGRPHLKPLARRLEAIEEREGCYWIDLENDKCHPTALARLALAKIARGR